MKKEEFEKEPPSILTRLYCGFLGILLFLTGIAFLPVLIGILFLIGAYYCFKKADIFWWIFIFILFDIFNN